MYIATCVAVFLAAYLLNVLTITVGYHRGLAHGAVTLSPFLRRLVVTGGSWVTGLDPKAWVVMHRLHHAHSDTALDPHSPVNVGLVGVLREQLTSYERVIRGLHKADPAYTKYAQDLDFPLSRLNTSGRWWLPYVVHAVVALALGCVGGFWLLAACYYFGMMSHPFQGGTVNALGHAMGGRNFDTDDNSRNNHLAAWLIAGEGFQNNHHRFPSSAKFSYLPSEIDMGYGACRVMEALGLLQVEEEKLISSPPTRALSPLT